MPATTMFSSSGVLLSKDEMAAIAEVEMVDHLHSQGTLEAFGDIPIENAVVYRAQLHA
jgi:hypothetical protein